MNCNYDCDETEYPSLSSNGCLMKDVTVLFYPRTTVFILSF